MDLPKSRNGKKTPNNQYARKIDKFGRNAKAIAILMMIGTIGATFLFASFDIVESGHVKIAVQPDGTMVGPIEAGWHMFWCSPFAKKYDFQITAQTITLTGLHADTLDGHVNIDLTASYILARQNVTKLFLKYGADYKSFVEAVVTSAFRDAFSGNTMRAVALENRSYVQSTCRERITRGLQDYYINLLSLLVQNIALPTDFSNAQIQTQIAYEQLRAANISREIQILNATTAADVKIIEAEALANASVIQAQGLSDALDIVVQSLNVSGNLNETEVLTYLWIQALTDFAQYGNVLLITDGQTPYIIDVPG
ncbi:MAG: SPFH domain-containing protein [Promethearchaeota archaeon]